MTVFDPFWAQSVTTPITITRKARETNLVLLEQSRYDERLEDEQASEVHSIDLVDTKLPGLVQRRCPRVRLSIVVERVRRVVYPETTKLTTCGQIVLFTTTVDHSLG